MPKYQNTHMFVQPLMIEGKRIIVRPGDVIELSKEIDLKYASFLEKVDEKTPIKKTSVPEPVKKPNPIIDNVKKQLAETHETVNQTISSAKEAMTGEVKTVAEKVDLVLKRLEIMKKAIEINTQAIKNIEDVVYSTDMFIIDTEEETKEGEKK